MWLCERPCLGHRHRI
ncbi:hypothetical protein F383_29764 [Gossypium arboreum]|uniref:Uncharacterized protein n=1 Tax=Gossypium arboreum TaxID=29729 RepID=A0A0B0PE45_GOSAR|nr:hypothetical protein F383_29764 [Gossypium arboreum]